MVPEQEQPPSAEQRHQLRQELLEIVKERGREALQDIDLTR